MNHESPIGRQLAGPFRSNAGFLEALARAWDEAAIRHHRRIRPTHILAGILYSPDARVVAVLEELGIPLDALMEQSVMAIGLPVPPNEYGPDLAYTRRATDVYCGAAISAERMGHDWLGAVHLLAAISEHGSGSASRVLVDLGADATRLWTAIQHIGAKLPPPSSSERPLFVPVIAPS